MIRSTLALAGLMALSACGPIVQIGGGGKPPAFLMTLRAEAVAPAQPEAAPPRRIVLVETPAVVGAVQTLRVPVTTADTRIAYLVGGSWVEPPARLFQRLLIERMGAGGLTALSAGQFDGRADRRLRGTLTEFGLDVRSAPAVRIRYSAALSDAGGALVAVREFTASEPVADQTAATVAEALNRAANRVGGEVTSWAAGA